MNCSCWISSLFCPSILSFFLTCLCSCLLGPPASQGAPLLECRCCHCHTCTTHRPSFLPLHSVSPGVQVLLFPFLYSTCSHHTSAYTPIPPLFVFVVVGVPQCTLSRCFVVLNISIMSVLLIPLLFPSLIVIPHFRCLMQLVQVVVKHIQRREGFLMWFNFSISASMRTIGLIVPVRVCKHDGWSCLCWMVFSSPSHSLYLKMSSIHREF